MAFRTVGNLKDSVAGILTGTNLNNVTNLYGAFERAMRTLSQQVDIPEASGRQVYNLYDGVYDYLAPTTIFGGAINDLRPQGVSRTPMDVVYRVPIEAFDETKASLPNGYQVTFEFRAGVGIMRVAQVKAKDSIQLDPMDVTTGWTVGGTIASVVQDETVYYESPASMRFTLTGSGTGTLTKTLTSPLDLTSYQSVGVNFLALYIPTVANLTSVTLRLGSDSANYYEVSATDGFLGTWLSSTFQLTDLDLASATTTGTPDITKIDYVQVIFAHTGTITNMRAGRLFISLPSPHELLFQSAAVFLSGGVLSSTITDDNDEIILNESAFTLLEYEASKAVCLQMGGTLATGSIQTMDAILNGRGNDQGLYVKYRADNPSNEIRTVGSYYD